MGNALTTGRKEGLYEEQWEVTALSERKARMTYCNHEACLLVPAWFPKNKSRLRATYQGAAEKPQTVMVDETRVLAM